LAPAPVPPVPVPPPPPRLAPVPVHTDTPDESFIHLFFECNSTKIALSNFYAKYLPEWSNFSNEAKKKFLFMGVNPSTDKRDNFFISTLAIVILFYIWECKLQKKIPYMEAMANEVFYTLENIRRVSNKCQTDMLIDLAICRDWKAETVRRE
jgi:hypothetical protein